MQPKHFFYINILRAKIRAKKAYSLLELSVVITIMSILMMGVASIVNNSMKKAQKNETQEKMQIIYNALGKFLLRQARFPCPAPLNIAENSNSYGDESIAAGGNCNIVADAIFTSNNNFFIGAVPTTTLGLPSDMAKDEFGNKITYIISRNATIATTPELVTASITTSIFPSDDNGFGTTNYTTLNVFEYSTDVSPITLATARIITDQAIFALISHGNNKNCAYPSNGTSANLPCPITDENTNSRNKYNPDINNINNNIIYSSTNPNFDDIVLFKTKNQIASDFNAHHLILCNANISELIFNNYKRTTTDPDNTGPLRSTNQSIFYEQNLFHKDPGNSCQLICGKYGVLFQSKSTCPS